jgi:hypothetical protein
MVDASLEAVDSLWKARIYASQRALSTFDLESAQGLRRPHFCLIYGSAQPERIKIECSLDPHRPPGTSPKSYKNILEVNFFIGCRI